MLLFVVEINTVQLPMSTLPVPILIVFCRLLTMHESGLMEIWKRKWWPQSQICSSNVKTEAKPIALLDVQSAFYIAFSKLTFHGLL